MKKISALISLIALGSLAISQGIEPQLQRSVTDPEKGILVEFSAQSNYPDILPAGQIQAPLAPEVNWIAGDAASIDNLAKVSSATGQTIAAWGLNDQRISLYGDSNIPVWEVMCPITAWDEVIDMTDDGSRIINGYSEFVEVYEPATSTPVWSAIISGLAVRGVQIQDDGQKVFVAAGDVAAQDSSFIFAYTVGEDTPDWTMAFPGNFTALVVSRSGNRVLLGEYGSGINKLFVMDGSDGSLISELSYACQNPPAVSHDGKYIVSGDYSGHAFLYEYDESISSYTERWSYTATGGTSTWVCGMGISADGSTLAFGTMIFTSTGGYDGELYVFNNYSPVPIWIYGHMGDMVQSVDISDDGSIIAAGGWGPLDVSGPELFLFRKQSNDPYLTVDSPGSIFCVDVSPDGSFCVGGGKAVHARMFGMGGRLFNVTADLGGGTLHGVVTKEGSDQQAGSKIEILNLETYFTLTDESGEYNLGYIPEGTYTVRFSAVGYVPQEIEGIVITEGEVTMQDITLVPAGEPPVGLVATQGAGLAVDLSWEPSPTAGIVGYNIYRKQYSFDFYPEMPLAMVGPEVLSYPDETALPLSHYYYVVTATISEELQTPYSNEASGWISTGFLTDEISAYAGTVPVIDGTINADEWADAFEVDLSNVLGLRDGIIRPIGSIMGWFKVNPEKTLLYVAVDNTYDETLEDHDEVALYIDDNNDGFYPPLGDSTEGNYWAVYYGSGNLIRYRPIYSNGGVGLVELVPDAQIEVSIASGHLVYEFAIPLGQDTCWQINYNDQDQSGLFLFVLNDPVDYDGWWPITNLNIFTAEGYGVITFGAEDEVPPPPENLEAFSTNGPEITLEWDQPGINDFDHFNIYWSTDNGSTYELLDFTVGVQYFYTLPQEGLYYFYVTVVDQAGHESEPSNIVEVLLNVGIDDPGFKGDISMIKMGPNPFENQLNIDLRIENETSLDIRIIDVTGKTIVSVYHSRVNPGLHHIAWNGKSGSENDLLPGLYLVRFDTGNGSVKTMKLVVGD